MMKKAIGCFLINFILLITLMFSWAGHDTGVNGYRIDGVRSSVSAVSMLKGQVHPISSTPVEKSESVERTAKTVSIFCHAGIFCVAFCALTGFLFILAPHRALSLYYHLKLRRRDYLIEFIHNKDGGKGFLFCM